MGVMTALMNECSAELHLVMSWHLYGSHEWQVIGSAMIQQVEHKASRHNMVLQSANMANYQYIVVIGLFFQSLSWKTWRCTRPSVPLFTRVSLSEMCSWAPSGQSLFTVMLCSCVIGFYLLCIWTTVVCQKIHASGRALVTVT